MVGKMMADPLVLSIFPGIDLLGMAFEQEGFCIVRGPDLLWGGDIKTFHPPAGVFEGVIGGPPCQAFSDMRFLTRREHENLIPEFERVVRETQPMWFLMENVIKAPEPVVPGCFVKSVIVSIRLLGEIQDRKRRFSFGTNTGRSLMIASVALERMDYSEAVTSSIRERGVAIDRRRVPMPDGRRPGPNHGVRIPVSRMAELQGLPGDFFDGTPFNESAKRQMIGNGVPLPMGRAVAKAVKRAMYPERVTAEAR
jgi:DNA (cytosine-5)-methyltransferase 1